MPSTVSQCHGSPASRLSQWLTVQHQRMGPWHHPEPHPNARPGLTSGREDRCDAGL